jgi:hypothetical protein
MFETPLLAVILIVPLLFAVLFPLLRRRKARSPTLNHFLLASGSLRRGE